MGSWSIDELAAGAYPLAGQVEGWTDFMRLSPEVVWKEKATSEVRNNTTTLENDDDLFWDVVSGGRYQFGIFGAYTSGTTPDLKGGWSYPSGSTIRWGGLSSDTAGAITIISSQTETETMVAAGSGTDLFFMWTGRVVAGADGLLRFQWAQNALEASNTTLYDGTTAYLARYA